MIWDVCVGNRCMFECYKYGGRQSRWLRYFITCNEGHKCGLREVWQCESDWSLTLPISLSSPLGCCTITSVHTCTVTSKASTKDLTSNLGYNALHKKRQNNNSSTQDDAQNHHSCKLTLNVVFRTHASNKIHSYCSDQYIQSWESCDLDWNRSLTHHLTFTVIHHLQHS